MADNHVPIATTAADATAIATSSTPCATSPSAARALPLAATIAAARRVPAAAATAAATLTSRRPPSHHHQHNHLDDRTEQSLGCGPDSGLVRHHRNISDSISLGPASGSTSNAGKDTTSDWTSSTSTSTAYSSDPMSALVQAPAMLDARPVQIKSTGVTKAGNVSSGESIATDANALDPVATSSPTQDLASTDGTASASTALVSVPPVPNNTRKLCLRHQRMADENTTAKLQKSIESLPLADQTAVNTVWTIFSSSPHPRRALILQGLLTMCCFSQLSLLSEELALAIRIDPFSLFPREVSLKVLGYLDASSLGRAAQVSRLWRSLADDDILWRNMCMQHIERKCEKCGWGLPLLKDGNRRRKAAKPGAGALSLVGTGSPKVPLASLNGSANDAHRAVTSTSGATAAAAQVAVGAAASGGSLKRTITAAANAAAQERHRAANSTQTSPVLHPQMKAAEVDEIDIDAPPNKRQRKEASAETASKTPATSTSAVTKSSAVTRTAAAPLTRPWKSVYCERLKIERNWRKCRYTTKVLSGHEDGIMCLDYNDHLSHPQFPVLITGSYDRTARVWNLDTGEQLHVLRGHTRVVRCLQFDDAKLITGSMDRTLKIWNWRTGELMRTLEGHTEGILCLNFNEEILASGSLDSSIKIWNFRTGRCFTLRGHTDWVNNVMLWSGPGSAASGNAAVKKGVGNDATSWGERPMRATPAPAVIGLNDEEQESMAAKHFLFSASDDGTIRLWDLGLRECILAFEGHVGQVQSIKLIHLDDSAVRKLVRNALGGPGAEEAERRRQELVAAQHLQHQQALGVAGGGAAVSGATNDVFPLPTPNSMPPLPSSQSQNRQASSSESGAGGSAQRTGAAADASDSYFHLRPHESTNGQPSSGGDASHASTGGNADDAEGSGCPILPTTPSFSHNATRSRSGSNLGGSGTPLASGLVLRHSPGLGGSAGGPSGSGAATSTAATASAPTFPSPLSDPARSSSRNRAHVNEAASSSELNGNGYHSPRRPTTDFAHHDESHYDLHNGPVSHHRRPLDPVLAHVQQRLEAAGLVPPLPLDAEMGDIEGPLSEAFDEQDFGHATGSQGAAATADGVASTVHYASSSGGRSPAPRRASTTTTNASKTASGAAAAAPSHAPSNTRRPILVSGSLDNTIKLWDVRTGRCLRTFFGHVQGVWSLDADKLRIISASLDRTIKIWDRETGFCQNTLVGHRGAVTCVALGDDKIVSGSDDNDVRVWSFADP